MKEKSKETIIAQAYDYAASRCATSEQCRYDIGRKLADRGLSDKEVEQILDRLESEKYIDEARYAEAFVRDKYRFSGWGRVKIARALAEKHIDVDTREDAMEAIDDDEYTEKLTNALSAKARSLHRDTPYKRREKLIRFALSRGYAYHEAADVIASLPGDDDDDYEANYSTQYDDDFYE